MDPFIQEHKSLRGSYRLKCYDLCAAITYVNVHLTIFFQVFRYFNRKYLIEKVHISNPNLAVVVHVCIFEVVSQNCRHQKGCLPESLYAIRADDFINVGPCLKKRSV